MHPFGIFLTTYINTTIENEQEYTPTTIPSPSLSWSSSSSSHCCSSQVSKCLTSFFPITCVSKQLTYGRVSLIQGHYGHHRRQKAREPPSPSRTIAPTPSGRAHCLAMAPASSEAEASSFPLAPPPPSLHRPAGPAASGPAPVASSPPPPPRLPTAPARPGTAAAPSTARSVAFHRSASRSSPSAEAETVPPWISTT